MGVKPNREPSNCNEPIIHVSKYHAKFCNLRPHSTHGRSNQAVLWMRPSPRPWV
jgi:hypothetical protein